MSSRFRSRQGFLVTTELLWFGVVTGVPCVATWFSGFKQLLCHDIVFPFRDSAFVSLLKQCRNKGFLVTTETVMTRGQAL